MTCVRRGGHESRAAYDSKAVTFDFASKRGARSSVRRRDKWSITSRPFTAFSHLAFQIIATKVGRRFGRFRCERREIANLLYDTLCQVFRKEAIFPAIPHRGSTTHGVRWRKHLRGPTRWPARREH